jgi:hypothetical protein
LQRLVVNWLAEVGASTLIIRVREIGRKHTRSSERQIFAAADSVLSAKLICALSGNLVSQNHYLPGDNIMFSERSEIALISAPGLPPYVDSKVNCHLWFTIKCKTLNRACNLN